MMNPEVKTLWIAALRSGQIEQGFGFLHPSQKSFCCLGVLCNLHAQATGGRWDVDPFPWRGYETQTHILPRTVLAWAGLEAADPEIEGHSLSEYNDGSGVSHPHTFTEIADLIERHL